MLIPKVGKAQPHRQKVTVFEAISLLEMAMEAKLLRPKRPSQNTVHLGNVICFVILLPNSQLSWIPYKLFLIRSGRWNQPYYYIKRDSKTKRYNNSTNLVMMKRGLLILSTAICINSTSSVFWWANLHRLSGLPEVTQLGKGRTKRRTKISWPCSMLYHNLRGLGQISVHRIHIRKVEKE